MSRDLGQAEELYVMLHGALAPSRSMSEKVSGSKTPPLPLRLTILAAGEELAAVLREWEAATAAAEGLSVPRTRVRAAYGVSRAVRVLSGRVRASCAASPEHALRLGRATTVARRLLGLTRLVHRLDAPCPGCGTFGLNREDGAAMIRCVVCGAAWSEDLYQHLVTVITSEYEDPA